MRTDFINKIAEHFNAQRYLEIGVDDATLNFDKIDIPFKVGVDPAYNDTHKGKNIETLTSDAFFEKQDSHMDIDIAFIDGLHHWEQLVKDIKNTIDHMTKGFIICHDTTPYSEEMQTRERTTHQWTGDVWKAVYYLKTHSTINTTFTINADYGCFVIVVDEYTFSEDIEPITDEVFEKVNALDWNFYLNNFSNIHDVLVSKDKLDAMLMWMRYGFL